MIPGFQSTRVPARFATFVYLVLAVLVASGIWVLERKWMGIKRIVLAVVMLGMMIEYVSFPLDFYGIPNNGKCPPVYKWLALHPKNALMEVPLGTLDTPEGSDWDWRYIESEFEYYSTFHWFPIMNGYSSFIPPVHVYATNVHLNNQLQLARASGIKYIIVHRQYFAQEFLNKVPAEMHRSGFEMKYAGNGAWVFESGAIQKLPIISFTDAEFKIADGQQFRSLLTMNIKVQYKGKPVLVPYLINATIQWLRNNDVVLKQKVRLQTQMLIPVLHSGDELSIIGNTPVDSGSYQLMLELPDGIRMEKSVTVLP